MTTSFSGTTLMTTSTLTFATFSIHARHTSSLNNSDIDFSVPSIWLIKHASTTQFGSFSKWFSSFQFFTPTMTIFPSDLYLPLSFSVFPEPQIAAHLGLEHSVCNKCSLDIDGDGDVDPDDGILCLGCSSSDAMRGIPNE